MVIQGYRSWCQSKAHVRLHISQLIATLALSATVFEILTLKARKSQNFPTPRFFEAPSGNLLEFCDEIWHQKTRIVRLPDGEDAHHDDVHDASLLRFDTIPTRDG